MPITPYSTPIKTEYKPLGFEAFASPLSSMSDKLEKTKTALDEAEYNISRLTPDDDRAKELITTLKSKTEEIASNLVSSKNYQQAAKQLKDLNKLYNKDPELSSIKSNYAKAEEAKLYNLALLKEDKISQKQYDDWEFRTFHQFKGTNFDPKTGKYSSIQINNPILNREDDIRKDAMNALKSTVSETIEQLGQYINVTDEMKERIKTKFETKDLNKLTEEITNWISTSDKYKEFLDNSADNDWYKRRYSNEEAGIQFSNDVLENAFNSYQNEFNFYKNAADKVEDPTLKKEYTNKAKNAEEVFNAFKDQLGNISNQEELDFFSNQIYKDFNRNKLRQIGRASADLGDYQNISYSTEHFTDPLYKQRRDNATKALEEFENIPTITTNVSPSGDTPLSGGLSTGSTLEIKSMNLNKDLYNEVSNTKLDAVPSLVEYHLNPNTENYDVTSQVYEKTKHATKNFQVISWGIERADEAISKKNTDIVNLKNELSNASGAEKERIESEIKVLYSDIAEQKISKYAYTAILENVMEDLNKENPAFKDLDVQKTLNYLLKENYAFLENGKVPAGYKSANQTVNVKDLQVDKSNLPADNLNVNPNIDLSPTDYYYGKEQLTLDELFKKFGPTVDLTRFTKVPIYLTKNTATQATNLATKEESVSKSSLSLTENVKLSLRINEEMVKHMSKRLGKNSSEVVMDKSFDAYTNKAGERIKNFSEQNQDGYSQIVPVEFDLNENTTKPKLSDDKFNLSYYNEDPHWVGNDQNGDPIFRKVLKREYTEEGTANAAISNALNKGGSYIPGQPKTAIPIGENDKKSFYASNPVNFYYTVRGTNIDIIREATDSYVKYADAALLNSDVNPAQAGKVFTKNLETYSNIAIGGSPGRRTRYNRFAVALQNAADSNNKYYEAVQPPAVWKNTEDGKQLGFSTVYRIIDGDIITTVNKVILDAETGNMEIVPIKNGRLNRKGTLANQLFENDLIWGTGDESDQIYHTIGIGKETEYVPAFRNLEFAEGISNVN